MLLINKPVKCWQLPNFWCPSKYQRIIAEQCKRNPNDSLIEDHSKNYLYKLLRVNRLISSWLNFISFQGSRFIDQIHWSIDHTCGPIKEECIDRSSINSQCVVIVTFNYRSRTKGMFKSYKIQEKSSMYSHIN